MGNTDMFGEVISALEWWMEAKKDADAVRESLQGNYEAGYYWDRAPEREREERAVATLKARIDSYIDSRITAMQNRECRKQGM